MVMVFKVLVYVFIIGIIGFFHNVYAEKIYRLIVTVDNQTEKNRLVMLGFTQCKPHRNNKLICLESKDINQLLRLRDFLISQNIDSQIAEADLKSYIQKEKGKTIKEQNQTIEELAKKHEKEFLTKEFFKPELPIKKLEKKEGIKNSLDKKLKLMYLNLNRNNLSEAKKIAEEILNTKYCTEAKFVIGLINLRLGNFKDACEIFSSINHLIKDVKLLEAEACWIHYMQKGYNSLEQRELLEATTNFEKSLSYKENIESKIGMFYVLLRQKNLDVAGKLINDLYVNFPKDKRVIKAYVDFLLETKQFDRIAEFEDYITEDQKNTLNKIKVYSEIEKANQLIKEGELEKAENLLIELYSTHPSNVDILLSLGYLYAEKGDLEKAEHYYKAALNYEKSNIYGLRGLKGIYVKLGKYEDALDMIEQLKKNGIKEEDESKITELLYLDKAKKSLELGDLHQAESHLRKVLDINPNNPTAHLLLADVYKRTGNKENYIRFSSRAFELEPENLGIKLHYVYSLIDVEMLEQAKSILDSIDKKTLTSDEKEKINKAYKLLYSKLASKYLNQKDYTKARGIALEGIDKLGMEIELLEVLGWSCLNLKDFDCSKKAFQQMLSMDSSNETAKIGLGYVYLATKQKKELIKLVKPLEESKDKMILEHLAKIYISTGKYLDAERVINKLENTVLLENLFLNKELKDSSENTIVEKLKETIKKEMQDYTTYTEIGIKLRERSGEPGKSKLTDISPYIMVTHFYNENLSLYAGSYFTSLDSGNLLDYNNFGSMQGMEIKREVPSKYRGIEPFFGVNAQNEDFILSSRISSTPMVNNDIKPKISYMFEGKIKMDNIKTGIGIYNRPIRDSITSYVGTVDPFSTHINWGRVTESGIKLSFEKYQDQTYFIYAELNKGSINGENTKDNKRLNFIVVPKFKIKNLISDEELIGLFIMYDSFQRDQDCYQYECGGYFSPKNLLILAPMLEGYKYLSNNFGIHYKVFLGLLSMNNKGKNSVDASFDGYIGGVYKINSKLFLNIAGEYRRTSSYNETFGFVSIQYFFKDRYNVTEIDLLRQEREIYKTW